jgi:photosystem II stability/assembly factor-like uncharacterized protein
MGRKLLVLIGTRKGAFVLEGDERRRDWKMRGPYCETWPIHHLVHHPVSGMLYAAGGSPWYGASVWRSPDMGETWTQSSEGLTYGDEGPGIETIWNLTPSDGLLYAGVEPAGLFRSGDAGLTWEHVSGLRDHPTRPSWQPGNGGLCLHSIVPHELDPQQMWVGISAVGTFHTTDGGATWETQNRGVRADFSPEKYPETGQCVHKLLSVPGQPGTLFQQNHCGVYRSRDAGGSWEEITEGLPSQFGFPLALHPHDPEALYVIPLNGDDRGRYMPDAKAAVWSSRDAGDSWTRLDRGLPQQDAYLGVLRESMAVDPLEPAGVYFGTSTGQLFGSRDEGRSWTLMADFLPAIWSVETALVEA